MLITKVDKIKWIYLKDNPYKIEALAFLDYDMPNKSRGIFRIYLQIEKTYLNQYY